MASEAFPFSLKEQLFFVAVVALSVLFNLAVLPVCQLFITLIATTQFGHFVEACFIGCYFTQVGILGCWSAMFSGSLLLRMLIANLLLVVVYFLIYELMEKFFIDVLQMRQRWQLQTGWATLVVCLNATQIPLLLMRRVTGYSLVLHDKPTTDSRFRQFSIADIFGLMTFASVPLLILSIFFEPAKDVAALSAIVIASGVITWLIIWVGLRPQWSAKGIFFLVLVGPIVVWLTFGLLLGLWTQTFWGTPVYWIYLSAYIGVMFQAGWVVLATRMFGYRLLKFTLPSEA